MRRTVIVGTALLTLPVGQLEGPGHLGFWPCFLLRHCDPILVCDVEVYELAQHVHGSPFSHVSFSPILSGPFHRCYIFGLIVPFRAYNPRRS